jgi:hypothetical protein
MVEGDHRSVQRAIPTRGRSLLAHIDDRSAKSHRTIGDAASGESIDAADEEDQPDADDDHTRAPVGVDPAATAGVAVTVDR